MFLRGGEVWRQRYLLSQRQYMWYLYYTPNLSLHYILSCYQGDNYSPSYRIFSIIRLPYKYPRTWAPRPGWHYWFIAFLAILLLFISCVLSLFRLRTWGFTFSIYFLSSILSTSYTNLRYITSYLSTSTRHPQDRASDFQVLISNKIFLLKFFNSLKFNQQQAPLSPSRFVTIRIYRFNWF